MQVALKAVRNGTASQRAACKEFGVPRGTLQDKLAGRVLRIKNIGNLDYSLLMAKRGFRRKKVDLLNTVEKIVTEDNGKSIS